MSASAHVAMHLWGAWGALPIFVAGIAYMRVWFRGVATPRGSWAELRDVLSVLIPTIAGAAIFISAIFEYGT